MSDTNLDLARTAALFRKYEKLSTFDLMERLDAAETELADTAEVIVAQNQANADLRAQVESMTAAMKWTDEVYPDRIYGGGARVDLTWDEFNRMREAIGLKPRGRLDEEEKKSTLNHRLRCRIKELEATQLTRHQSETK